MSDSSNDTFNAPRRQFIGDLAAVAAVACTRRGPEEDCRQSCDDAACGRGIDAAASAFVGGLVGRLTGAIIGAVRKTEQWQIVTARPKPPTVSTHWPSPRRLSIGLHRTF